MRDWLGEEPGLKALAFVLLLPLAALNLYLIIGGIDSAANPSAWFGSAFGIMVLLVGGIGLAVQLVLMNVARESPGGAGYGFLGIGLLVLVVAALLGTSFTVAVTLALAAPLPGALALIFAGWHEDHARSQRIA